MTLFKTYQFQSNLKISLLTLLFLPMLISLGIWQLHRADYKKQLQTQYQTRAQAQPVALESIITSNDVNYLSVKMQGKFDSHHIILLDNKFYNHQSGYHIVVPFKQKDIAVLINLGWLAQGQDRSQLPIISLPNTTIDIKGTINILSGKGFWLGVNADPSLARWPLRLQQLDTEYLAHKLGYPLAPFMVLLAPDQPYGFIRDWAPASLNPQMHLGYAFQWFALAVTLVILFLVSSIKRK